MLEQPLIFSGCLNIQFFNSTPFPKNSEATFDTSPLVLLKGCLATLLVTKYLPPNSYLGKQRISLGVEMILKNGLYSHT